MSNPHPLILQNARLPHSNKKCYPRLRRGQWAMPFFPHKKWGQKIKANNDPFGVRYPHGCCDSSWELTLLFLHSNAVIELNSVNLHFVSLSMRCEKSSGCRQTTGRERCRETYRNTEATRQVETPNFLGTLNARLTCKSANLNSVKLYYGTELQTPECRKWCEHFEATPWNDTSSQYCT